MPVVEFEPAPCQWDSNPHLPDNSGTLLSRLSPSPVFIPGCDMAGKISPTSATLARAENFTAGDILREAGRAAAPGGCPPYPSAFWPA